MNLSIDEIFKIGAILVVIAGIIGAFYTGSKKQRATTEEADVNTITLINEARKALEEKMKTMKEESDKKQQEMQATIDAQGKRIAELELVNASYVKLFQGNPSQLESWMKEIAAGTAAIHSLLQAQSGQKSSITINGAKT
jgi:predicted secreted protein